MNAHQRRKKGRWRQQMNWRFANCPDRFRSKPLPRMREWSTEGLGDAFFEPLVSLAQKRVTPFPCKVIDETTPFIAGVAPYQRYALNLLMKSPRATIVLLPRRHR